ncbi:hypothetical protein [Thermocatellispora tengchongensis]|uniref:hypothetical protein n=1 Tax=Thermocatellispora tengchongensis TaxID=1073253 RepID=UPI003645F48C
MRLASILRDGRALPALAGDRGVVAIDDLKPGLPADAMAFLEPQAWQEVVALARQAPTASSCPRVRSSSPRRTAARARYGASA